MDNKTLFDFFLLITSTYCMEFCTNFDRDAVEYRGVQVLKGHISYLEELHTKLEVE